MSMQADGRNCFANLSFGSNMRADNPWTQDRRAVRIHRSDHRDVAPSRRNAWPRPTAPHDDDVACKGRTLRESRLPRARSSSAPRA